MTDVTRIEDGVEVIRSAADDAAIYGAPQPLAPPAPRSATAKQVRYALTDLGVRDAWEAAAGPGKATPAVQDWWGWTDPFVEDAVKLVRLCSKVGVTPAALFDKALAE